MTDVYDVKVTFTEPLLGTVPKDKSIYEIVNPDLPDETLAEEVETIPETVSPERGWTGFHTDENGDIFLYDYVIKGFMKSACGALRRVTGTKSNKIRAYKKIIDTLVFVKPRRILLELPAGCDPDDLAVLARPLRGQTPKGERVTLVKSDMAPIDTTFEFALHILGSVTEAQLKEWFDYGEWHGFGQWRNASYGTFTYEMTKWE